MMLQPVNVLVLNLVADASERVALKGYQEREKDRPRQGYHSREGIGHGRIRAVEKDCLEPVRQKPTPRGRNTVSH